MTSHQAAKTTTCSSTSTCWHCWSASPTTRRTRAQLDRLWSEMGGGGGGGGGWQQRIASSSAVIPPPQKQTPIIGRSNEMFYAVATSLLSVRTHGRRPDPVLEEEARRQIAQSSMASHAAADSLTQTTRTQT